MVEYSWNEEKNRWLINTRGVSFEQAVVIIEEKSVLAIIKHPNQHKYPKQSVFLLMINRYVHMVPFIKKGKVLFLKTIIPSRKYQRKYKEII